MEIVFTVGPRCLHSFADIIMRGATCARLTFSYGTPEEQLARALQIKEAAVSVGSAISICGELEGPRYRIGAFFHGEDEVGSLNVGVDEEVRIIKQPTAQLGGPIKLLPINSYDQTKFVLGSRLIYGNYAGEFEVVSADQDGALVRSLRSVELYATKSLSIAGALPLEIDLDYANRKQLEFICRNKIFDVLIVPGVRSAETFLELTRLARSIRPDVRIWSRVDSDISETELQRVLSASDNTVLDRSQISYSVSPFKMPRIVRRMIRSANDGRSKIIVTSQIADSVSIKDRSALSAAELSDIWTYLELGVGGFMLAEETAFDDSGPQAVSQVKNITLEWTIENGSFLDCGS